MAIPHSEALKDKTEGITDPPSKIPLVLPFYHCTTEVSKIVHKNAKILGSHISFGHLFKDNIITAFKNEQNFKQVLVRSKLKSVELPGTFPCGHTRCNTCPFVIQTNQLAGPIGSINLNGSFNCISQHVIYAILCTKCSAIYIGETGRRLGDRIREHLRHVRNNTTSSDVSIHFNADGHDINDLSVLVIKSVFDITKRRLAEAKLIRRLGTLHPLGLNREPDSNYKTG